MIKKNAFSDDLTSVQDIWAESPCSSCSAVHCCKNLPLTPLRLNNQNDFINLLLTSTYNDVKPVLNDTGKWTFYLKRDCTFLDRQKGQCTIHNSLIQSKICKSYDAHTCWYVEAFNTEKFSTMIPFNTKMIIWYEKRYNLIARKFDAGIRWNELCTAAYEYQSDKANLNPGVKSSYNLPTLSFKKSRSDQFLFLPPYKLPTKRKHFELLSFRLGFPGIYLAITDSCWAFMIKTDQNQAQLNLIRQEYYPSIEHKDGIYSFDQVMKEHTPFSKAGEQWIILQRSHLKILIDLTIFDDADKVVKIPSASDILKALKSGNPYSVSL